MTNIALIEKINRLQDLCGDATSALDLPQIVVIGGQSCGKTSVLENIVGRDFLPRGSGIVTRRPLILQLIYDKDATREFCEFAHAPQRFFDFDAVRAEIVDETNRVVRSRSDVSQTPITLRLFSTKVLPLTLVDLPGLVKVPMGDQPKNICAKIDEMCRKFASNKNAIILAVSAANIDIANSDALELARSVDPDYERTICVLTKIDIMDKGTDVVEIVAQRKINLRLGFVPIVNRSQADVVANKDIAASLADEKRFFETHAAYKKNKLCCGTPYLVQKLHGVLHEHIRACLPALAQRIEKQLGDAQAELSATGTQSLAPKEFVFKAINDASTSFSDVLHGRGDLSSAELCGGARLSYTFQHHFAGFIKRLSAPEMTDEEIRTLLYNSGGSSSTLLFTHVAFEKLATQSVALLKQPALKLVNVIFNELGRILQKVCENQRISRFPALHDRIVNCVVALFRRQAESTHKFVGAFVDWNVSYVNTRHPAFEKWKTTTEKPIDKRDTKKSAEEITFDPIPHTLRITKAMSERDVREVEGIKTLVRGYFDVIKEIVIDQVPKAIMAELVTKSENEMRAAMFAEVYDAKDIADVVTESPETKEKRATLERSVATLKQAYDIVCSI